MRFAVGQAFESVVSRRQAVVAEIRDGGHAGHLLFVDNGHKAMNSLGAISQRRRMDSDWNDRRRAKGRTAKLSPRCTRRRSFKVSSRKARFAAVASRSISAAG